MPNRSHPPQGEGSRTSLCFWLPTFELRLELVRSPELDATSVALLSPGECIERREVQQVSERGARSGVSPGMPVSRAVSLCPSLTLLEPDPAHYDAAMEAILERLGELSPVVEARERGVVHIGVDGLGRLYGSPANQACRMLEALLDILPRPLVAAMRVGRAPGTFAARVAAVSAHPGEPVLVDECELAAFLAPHPVTTLPLPDDAFERLARLGVATLGEFGRLSETALLRQFGPAGRHARELARGERIEAVRPLHRPRPIRASMDFPTPVGDREALHRALDRLLDRGLKRDERRDRAIRGLRLGGYLEGGGSWVVESTLREPSARRNDLAYPLRSRLSLAPPPRALESLFVEFTDFGAPCMQTTLFEPRDKGTRSRNHAPLTEGNLSAPLREALRELKLKLGHSPLYRVVEVDPWSRIPERRHALMALEP
jgi:protein ImuB